MKKICKITVVKRTLNMDLVEKYGHPEPGYGPCPVFEEGQVFYTRGIFGNEMPEGFCAQAWPALIMPVNVLIGGGKVLGFDDVHIVSCADGNRPAIFMVQLASEEETAEQLRKQGEI